MKTITTTLANVEEGFAEVIDADTNRRIGRVVREKDESQRTSVAWFAFTGKTQVGRGYTRTEAVAILAAHVEAKRTAAAEFIANA